MKINISDIPKDKSFEDYPDNTEFVLDDRRNRIVDPDTGEIIRVRK